MHNPLIFQKIIATDTNTRGGKSSFILCSAMIIFWLHQNEIQEIWMDCAEKKAQIKFSILESFPVYIITLVFIIPLRRKVPSTNMNGLHSLPVNQILANTLHNLDANRTISFLFPQPLSISSALCKLESLKLNLFESSDKILLNFHLENHENTSLATLQNHHPFNTVVCD